MKFQLFNKQSKHTRIYLLGPSLLFTQPTRVARHSSKHVDFMDYWI